MNAAKMSISLEATLGEAVREAAQRSGKGLSAWVAEAAEAKLRSEALKYALDEWEAENGAFTEEELAWALAEQGRAQQATRAPRLRGVAEGGPAEG